ncbi:glycosyltransferase family 4 protein [Pseudodesulfovibrio sp. zrk46]|uniref:glycosyltransferase family 4 protein n=1 Tax=Pseudodesulfovibrio sp. zrk46 TaxID=2725288 RepID=UPI001449E3A2|nr:glycosyltransferase family 4 protein [Pseudodesulfovibrio sp. zrk46]QJB56311.1 glycosyltransferase family 4 protein [Pseudodesulfovibrio sp. zrk46]
MKTYIFLPPVKKPTGGVTVLRQIADILHQDGREVFLVARDQSGWRPEGLADAAPVIEWADMRLERQDMWLVPEGWVNALAPGLEAKCTCISYVQNWAYLFSSLPEGADWHTLPVEFLAVSEPVSYFIKETTCKDAPVLRPGIDRSIFHAPDKKPENKITIAYMPRKNKALVQQIKSIFEHQCGGSDNTNIRWRPIEGLDTHGVAEALRSSHIFLATGFPEGCPLPPLEAMACGCLPVGFTGFGGWDYMRQTQPEPRFKPWWPLQEVDWMGNGLWCADGDVLDAAMCLQDAVTMIREKDLYLDVALEAGQETANAYSTEEQRKSVLALWEAL